MATSELPARSGFDLNGAANLASLFTGKNTGTTGAETSTNTGGTTTSGTRTTSSGVSQSAIDATVQSILQGTQGLASVASGQNRAGLYNSSTNRMLVNDLIARAAAEGAKLNKSETVSVNETVADNRANTKTTNQTAKTQAPIDPAKAAMVTGGLSLASKLAGTDTGKKLLSNIFGPSKPSGGAANNAASSGDTNIRQVNDGTVDPAVANSATSNATPTFAADGSQVTSSVGRVGSVAFGSQDAVNNDVSVGSFGVGFDSGGNEFGGDLSFDPSIDVGADFGFTGGFDDNIDFGGLGDVINVGADFGFDGGFDTGIDFSGGGGATDFSMDNLFDFAEGGLVTKDGNKRLIDRITDYAGGRKIDDGTEEKKEAQPQKTADKPEPAEDKTGKKSLNTRIFDYINNRNRKPGFATGGMVDLTNTGLRNTATQSGTAIGVGSNDQTAGSVIGSRGGPAVSGRTSQSNQGTGTVKGTGSTNVAGQRIVTGRPRTPENEINAGPGTGAGTAAANASPASSGSGIGVSGAGAIGSAIGMATGLPGLGTVSGLANASNNSQAVASVVSAMAGLATGNPAIAMAINALINSANSSAAPSTPGSVAASNANAASAANGMDSLDALVAFLGANDSNQNVPVGVVDAFGGATGTGPGPAGVSTDGGVGVGTSDGGSVGSDGDGGVGAGGAFKDGGHVKGKGTSTSDSIDARLSDGEYVINAAAVKAVGVDFLDQINSAFQPAPAVKQQGNRVKAMQRGQ